MRGLSGIDGIRSMGLAMVLVVAALGCGSATNDPGAVGPAADELKGGTPAGGSDKAKGKHDSQAGAGSVDMEHGQGNAAGHGQGNAAGHGQGNNAAGHGADKSDQQGGKAGHGGKAGDGADDQASGADDDTNTDETK
jgi:hypothetical protein